MNKTIWKVTTYLKEVYEVEAKDKKEAIQKVAFDGIAYFEAKIIESKSDIKSVKKEKDNMEIMELKETIKNTEAQLRDLKLELAKIEKGIIRVGDIVSIKDLGKVYTTYVDKVIQLVSCFSNKTESLKTLGRYAYDVLPNTEDCYEVIGMDSEGFILIVAKDFYHSGKPVFLVSKKGLEKQ